MSFTELCGKSTQRPLLYSTHLLLHARVEDLMPHALWIQLFSDIWGRVATVPKLHSVHINWNGEVLREFR